MSKMGYVVEFDLETSEDAATFTNQTLIGSDLRKVLDRALSMTTPRARRYIGQQFGALLEAVSAEHGHAPVFCTRYFYPPRGVYSFLRVSSAEVVE